MKTQMHFRKRQLLEYQNELKSQLATEQTIQIEYPASPSSLNSGKSSPVGSETSADGTMPFEGQICESIDILSPISCTKNSDTLPDVENELQRCIEANLNQKSDEDNAKQSTLILDKLSEFREKSLIQSKDIVPKKETQTVSFVEPTPDKEIDEVNKVIALVGHEKEELVIEEMCVVDFNDCYVVEAKNYIETNPEYTPQVNDITTLVDKDSDVKDGPPPVAKPQEGYSDEEFKQIVNRITGVFAAVRHCQQRLEAFANEGVNVYEKAESYHRSVDYYTNSPASTSNSINKTATNFVHTTTPEKPISFSPTPTPSTSKNYRTYPFGLGDDQLVIGPNGTTMSKVAWAKIDWSLATASVTRKVLMAIFDRNTLATHTLTGKPSPAFRNMNKPEKKPLDLIKVADIIHLVTGRVNVTRKEVRMAITTKCADESKMAKWRNQKKTNKKM